MLSYLHGFHAGNAADVLKHSVLVFCLDYLKKKEKPLLCVDTHAGAGFYDLAGTAEKANHEWENGAGRLGIGRPGSCSPGTPGVSSPDGPSISPLGIGRPAGQPRVPAAGIGRHDILGIPGTEHPGAGRRDAGYPGAAAMPPMIASYAGLAAPDVNDSPGGIKFRYSGSPAIMAKLLRKGDRLVCFELHPGEAETLAGSMALFRGEKNAPKIEVRKEDGPGKLKSLLPPPSRRGLVLIDPPWEERNEYESIPQAVSEGLKRFPEGTFIVWYPLLSLPKEKSARSISETLFTLSGGKRCRAELYTGAVNAGREAKSPRGMYGSGLILYNPPWTLRSALEETLPYLAKTLGDKDGGWRLDWEE